MRITGESLTYAVLSHAKLQNKCTTCLIHTLHAHPALQFHPSIHLLSPWHYPAESPLPTAHPFLPLPPSIPSPLTHSTCVSFSATSYRPR
jgi:hypothetical protein